MSNYNPDWLKFIDFKFIDFADTQKKASKYINEAMNEMLDKLFLGEPGNGNRNTGQEADGDTQASTSGSNTDTGESSDDSASESPERNSDSQQVVFNDETVVYRGYKKLKPDYQSGILYSNNGNTIWLGTPPSLVAICTKTQKWPVPHTPPVETCMCGIYSVVDPIETRGYDGVLVELVSYGDVIVGRHKDGSERGYRASNAHVEAIVAQLCSRKDCDNVAEFYIDNYKCEECCRLYPPYKDDVITLYEDFGLAVLAYSLGVKFIIPDAVKEWSEKSKLKKQLKQDYIEELEFIKNKYMDMLIQERLVPNEVEAKDFLDDTPLTEIWRDSPYPRYSLTGNSGLGSGGYMGSFNL